MPTPLIPSAEALEFDQHHRMTAALQVAHGARQGFGRWSRYNLAAMGLRGDVPTQLVSISQIGGHVGFAHFGESAMMQIDTVGGFVLSGAGTSASLQFRVPEGWGFRARDPLGTGLLTVRHSGVILVLNNGVASAGFIEIGRLGPSIVAIFRDFNATPWVNGQCYLSGQLMWENLPDGGL